MVQDSQELWGIAIEAIIYVLCEHKQEKRKLQKKYLKQLWLRINIRHQTIVPGTSEDTQKTHI